MLKQVMMIAGLAIAGGVMASPAMAEKPSQLIILGDSNVDIGRVSTEASSGAVNDGLLPPPNTVGGRSSNGTILPEYLVERLAIPQSNFGWGGATSGWTNVVARRGIPDIERTGTLAQLQEFEAFLDGAPAHPEALYLVFAGSNDLALIEKNDQAAVDAAIERAIFNLSMIIAKLDELGAERIVVATRTPRPVLSDMDRPDLEPAQAAKNDAAGRQFNTRIRAMVAAADNTLDADIQLFDAYTEIRLMIAESGKNGFHPYEDSDAFFCVEREDCTGLINHDAAHKTSAVHERLAEAFIHQFGLGD